MSTFVYKPRTMPVEVPPSPQQTAIYDWIRQGTGSLLVEAGAGTGKTTLLLGSLRRIPDGSIFLGVYNKAIAVEIQEKADKAFLSNSRTRIGTMHSAGYGACRRVWQHTKVDDRKTIMIVKELGIRDSLVSFITKLVSFAKQFLIGVKFDVTNRAKWMELVDTFSLEQELTGDIRMEDAVECAIAVFSRSREIYESVLDFDDMIYAPLDQSLSLFKNDWVLMDEVQDSSAARIELARRMLKPGGRFIGAGDRTQSIYGFSGAMNDAMDQVKAGFNCQTKPLTVTYRCPKLIVKYSNEWMPKLEAPETAPNGIIRPVYTKCLTCRGTGKVLRVVKGEAPDTVCKVCKGAKRPWYLAEMIGRTDAILCRYTRPLIATAYGLLREGVACKVEGRDLGIGLKKLATRWKITTISKLEEKLAEYEARMVAKYEEEKRYTRAEELRDQVSTLRLIMDGMKERGKTLISEVTAEIDSLFADNVKGQITLCTGHRSKGREWRRVYIIQSPMRQSSKEWENVQERNIRGVMATRSLWEVILVPDEPRS